MKNKEIEELLNKMKNCNGVFDYYLEYGEVDLLLSHIEQLENLCNKYEQEHKTTYEIWKEDIKKSEQLEKENKILRENAEHNDKVVDKVNWENQQLKENYDRIYNENCKLREEHNITDVSLLDENQQLKKNRDKALKFIKENSYKKGDGTIMYDTDIQNLEDILKGGSDNE